MDISVVVASRPNRPPEQDLLTAVVADRLGYGEVWIGEGWVWDCFALATAIGLATDQIALTIGPVPVSLRDPAMIAVGVASASALTRRTVGIALGASSTRFVTGMHGRARHRPGTALAESAQVVRRLLAGERTDFQGEVLSTRGYRLTLDPPGGPLTIAAFGDRAVRTAAAHADRMVLDLVSPELAGEYRAKPGARAGRLDPGRDRPGPRLVRRAHGQSGRLPRGARLRRDVHCRRFRGGGSGDGRRCHPCGAARRAATERGEQDRPGRRPRHCAFAAGGLRRGRTRRGGARAGHCGRPGRRTHLDCARRVPLVSPAGGAPPWRIGPRALDGEVQAPPQRRLVHRAAPPLHSAGRISGAARRYHLVAVAPLDLGAMLTADRP